ncbi:SAGA-associated factor 29 homolog A isoform X2 [Aristolochia californica]|uniref:SAGA-associated factor 29 homolog A isoform X2 n=1 Tax=Aristolochia californica TaxID=171875 RepID=UPI0035D8BAFB
MSGVMDMGTMLENSKELDRLRKEQEGVFTEINKIHKKIQSISEFKLFRVEPAPEVVEKSGDSVLLRLRALYVQAKELSETEFNVSNALMGQLDTLLQSGLSAAQRKKMVSEQKKKRMKGDSDVPRHSPAASIRNQLEHAASLKGEQVAARVTPDDAEKDEWFVVKVIHFDKEAKEFEVLDEEPGDDEESVQRKYKLPMSRIIPFPKRGDPSSAPDFPHGRHVLAVYPSTTALYKATVVNPPRKRKTDDYLLEFDDDEEDGSLPQWTVPFHKVVPLPDGHRQ